MATITLDRERVLRFNVGAARRFREKYGKPLGEVRLPNAGGYAEILDPGCLAIVLWAGFLHEDEGVKVAQVEEMLDEYLAAKKPIGDVFAILGDAFEESGFFGRAEGKGKKPAETSSKRT